MRIAYLTDVEGMWSKLESFARDNPLVSLDAQQRLHVAPGALFVFGGDAIDRGPHARRIVATLLEARRRQPEQVVLLAGNRDINKLRLPRELGGTPLARTPEEVRAGPRPALLRWIFQNTMGAPGAFDFRRTELSIELGREASEEEVVDSFLADLAPGGPLRVYLAHCQLAFRAGRTLFVHGGLSEKSLGHVPGRPPPASVAAVDVERWLSELNTFYAEQLEAFERGTLRQGQPGWQPLLAYQAPLPGLRQNPCSVVYSRSVDEFNNLRLPTPPVIECLRKAGVERVVVGHTPSGDSPSLGRSSRFQLLCADNSHARHDQASRVFLLDERLVVDACTRLDGDDSRLHAVRFSLALDEEERSPIGLRTREEQRLVRGVLEDGALLLYRALPGWKTEQLAMAPEALARAALEPPAW